MILLKGCLCLVWSLISSTLRSCLINICSILHMFFLLASYWFNVYPLIIKNVKISSLQFWAMQLNFNGKKIALPFNFSIRNWATETRQILNEAELPSGVKFYNVYGTSFDTPFDVWYVPVSNQWKFCGYLLGQDVSYLCVDANVSVNNHIRLHNTWNIALGNLPDYYPSRFMFKEIILHTAI